MSKQDEEKKGYVPTGTYLDAGLSAADKAAVDDLGRQWQEAQAIGDQDAMNRLHQAAEEIRSGYGYSGGGDGSEYHPFGEDGSGTGTPGHGAGVGSGASGSPGVSGKGTVGDWTAGKFTYGTAPEYVNRYQDMLDEVTAQYLGRAAFEYDPEKDIAYQQYKDQYTRNGERAMQDTLGQVSARTGGLASSYAGSAAQQSYNQYMAALNDKIPELRQLAYQMYLDEGDAMLKKIATIQGLEQGEYDKFLTDLGQYNNMLNFDYGVFGDEVSQGQWQQTHDRGVFESDRDFARLVGRDQVDDQWKQTQWDYGVQQDELARGDQDREEAIARIYNYVDNGGDVAGIPTELLEQSGLSTVELEARAAEAATQRSQRDQKHDAEIAESQASTAAKYASMSKGSGGGGGKTSDDSATHSPDYADVKKTAAGYDDEDAAREYLYSMIDRNNQNPEEGVTAEEAEKIFHVILGYGLEPEQEDDVVSGGAPTTYDEFVAATGKTVIMDEDDFEKHMGKSGGTQYKNYQEYLNAMYRKYK